MRGPYVSLPSLVPSTLPLSRLCYVLKQPSGAPWTWNLLPSGIGSLIIRSYDIRFYILDKCGFCVGVLGLECDLCGARNLWCGTPTSYYYYYYHLRVLSAGLWSFGTSAVSVGNSEPPLLFWLAFLFSHCKFTLSEMGKPFQNLNLICKRLFVLELFRSPLPCSSSQTHLKP